jgi:hypothetical protein
VKDNVYILFLGKEVIGVFSSLPNLLKQRSIEALNRRKALSDFRVAKYILNIPGEESMLPSA